MIPGKLPSQLDCCGQTYIETLSSLYIYTPSFTWLSKDIDILVNMHSGNGVSAPHLADI